MRNIINVLWLWNGRYPLEEKGAGGGRSVGACHESSHFFQASTRGKRGWESCVWTYYYPGSHTSALVLFRWCFAHPTNNFCFFIRFPSSIMIRLNKRCIQKTTWLTLSYEDSLVMRAAAKKHNINIVAVNDPFIPVDYSKWNIVSFLSVYCVVCRILWLLIAFVTTQTRLLQ